MVGLDEHEYSDDALTWLLNELVDDGDEIVCVQVLDKDDKVLKGPKLPDKGYRQEAQETMEKIQKKSEIDQDRAIGITLEFAVGKLHSTILKMVRSISTVLGCYLLALLTNFHADSVVFASNADCWQQRSESCRISRPCCQPELLLKMVLAVFACPSSCSSTA
jgi:hypothetical protein